MGAKKSILISSFEEFECQMESIILQMNLNFLNMKDESNFYYKNAPDEFYGRKEKYPAIVYDIQSESISKNKRLTFEITIDDQLCAGFALYNMSTDTYGAESKDIFRNFDMSNNID